jgi:hypothetical protein
MKDQQEAPEPQQSSQVVEHLRSAQEAIDAIEEQTADHIASGGQVSFRQPRLASFAGNLKRAKDAVAAALSLT